ncbi:hypothetical protein N656DRAFT_648583 [Canariomyces notabilis]|uniref:Zn(2)-C6 fungal-type domain-containing protein n=1 Tax=Canariomyces notabilis TaxID=2074819 RepID=A0AAN6TF06_9PEZI|nr:hypothetical protein N656DRAFT_648583 [Canariomyces arenarius]
MSSSYPPPPASVPDGTTSNSIDTPQQQQQGPEDEPHPIHPAFAAEAAAAAAVAAAHHGLQALQAAVADSASVPIASPATVASQQQQQHATLPDASPYLADAGASAGPSSSPADIVTSAPPPRATRLRRACDMCSQRKVKCDEMQPCRPCNDLNVDCTFNRTMKRRGPPNKHAEAARAAKQQRLEPNLSPGPHHAAKTLISIAVGQDTQAVLDAESIAPWPVLTLLIDDFFTYIHPLAPFPHEPTFRMSFTTREDRTNRTFLALLASMIGCLAASFPRAVRQHLKAHQHGMNMYPKAITLIERCRTVALEARGASFYSKDDVTVYDAATSYFLGLAAGYVLQWKVCRRFMAETMSFIRELGYHKPRDLGSSMFGVTYRGPSFNHVEDQLGKRIFWCMFLGIRSMSQLGAPHGEIVLPPPTPSEPYPEFPVEVDDQYILAHQILGQPEGTVSLLTGFVQAIKIYMTMNGLVSVELSYGIATLPFHDQKVMLDECLQAVKHVMDDLPRELRIDLNSPDSGANHGLDNLLPTNSQTSNLFDDSGAGGLAYLNLGYQQQTPADFRHIVSAHPERRRLLQYEIQKANIYASQLATRSYYVERYLNLRDAHREHVRQAAAAAGASSFTPNGGGDASNPTDTANANNKSVAAAALRAAAEHHTQQHMVAERELIVQNLLTVLTTISQRNLEPNGGSLINKIRQVASTLVNDAPERKGPVAVKAEEGLRLFVDVLMRLERSGTGMPVGGGAGVGVGFNQIGIGGVGFNMGVGGMGWGFGVGVGVGVNGDGGGAGVAGGGMMEDEEQELRNWADLRQCQVRFLQGGGFMM